MFDTAGESLLSQAVSNITIYLRNANTHNSPMANYACSLPELLASSKRIMRAACLNC